LLERIANNVASHFLTAFFFLVSLLSLVFFFLLPEMSVVETTRVAPASSVTLAASPSYAHHDMPYPLTPLTSSASPPVVLVLHCFVQFLYAANTTGPSGNASAPFTASTPASVEVTSLPASSCVSFFVDSASGSHDAAGRVEVGLHIRPLSGAVPQTPNSNRTTARELKNETEGLTRRWGAARQGPTDDLQQKAPHQSVVRAVRRVPLDGACGDTTDTFWTGMSACSREGKGLRMRKSVSPPFWLPFSSLSSLDWSLYDAPDHAEQPLHLISNSDSLVKGHSPTLRGAPASQTHVVVNLHCKENVGAGTPRRDVDCVLLRGLLCSGALALADAFDAARHQQQQQQLQSRVSSSGTPSAVQPLPRTPPASLADPSCGLTVTETERRKPLQRSHTPSLPTCSDGGNTAHYRGGASPSSSACAATRFPAAATTHTLECTPPVAKGNGQSGADGTTPSKPMRSISFTDLADVDLPGGGQAQPHSAKTQSEPWVLQLLRNGESTAYSKYARMLGIETPQPSRHPSALHHSSMRAHSPIGGPRSSSSFAGSSGSEMTSTVFTPLGGTLQFPRRDSTGLSHTSPEEVDLSFQDGPLSVPASLSHRHLSRVPHRGGEMGGYGDTPHMTLPSVVETTTNMAMTAAAAADGPQWFPAAPYLSGASEVTMSFTDGSAQCDGAVRTHPEAVAAAAAAATSVSPEELRVTETYAGDPSGPRVLITNERPGGGRGPGTASSHAPAGAPPQVANDTAKQQSIIHPPPPPLPSSSSLTQSCVSLPPFGSAVVQTLADKEKKTSASVAPSFNYLTPEQRRLVDFDLLLRPTIPPPSSTATCTSTAGASWAVSAVSATTAESGVNAYRSPAVLDQILLKLRLSSLPTAETTAALATARSVAAPAAVSWAAMTQTSDRTPPTPGPLSHSAIGGTMPPQQTQQPPSTSAKVVPHAGASSPTPSSSPASPSAPVAESSQETPEAAESKSPSPRSATATTVASTTSRSHLVCSYREILQQMRDRTVRIPPSTTTTTNTIPAAIGSSAAKIAMSATAVGAEKTGSSASPPSLQLGSKSPFPADASATPAPAHTHGGVVEDAGLPGGGARGRGSVLLQRAHGPFAQPSQHPPGMFLAHGSHRVQASSLSSPLRHRRHLHPPLWSPAAPPAALANTAKDNLHSNEPQPRVLTNHHHHDSNSTGAVSSMDRSGQSDTQGSLVSPLWRGSRVRDGRAAHLPQSPMQMLPRRPEPLIGTPKLALEQASGVEKQLSPMMLGTWLLDDDGKPSLTSMAT
jgi:hypothetical protein